MNLLLKVNLCFIFLLCLSDLKGQTDFRPGYVITNTNDTLHGLIDYRGDKRNAKKCDFKKDEASVVQEFKQFDIKGFRFTSGKYYVSKTVKSNGGKIQLFLEFLVDGIADLYYYSDGTYFHYFIEKADGQLFELTNEERHNYGDDGHEYISETKTYIGLLRYAFADCPQLYSSIIRTSLETKSLIGITKKYHEQVCDGEKCIIYEKQLPFIKVKFAPFISMNASMLNFGNGNYWYKDMQFQTSNYPSIGLQINTSLARTTEKLSFQTSAELGKNYFYGNANYSGNTSSFQEVHLHSTFLIGKGGFKYTYPSGKLRPTIMVGGHIVNLIKKEGRRIQDMNENGAIHTTEYNDDLLASIQYGYNMDIGIDYHFSSSVAPFLSIGYTSSTGTNKEQAIRPYIYAQSIPLTTIIKTININAGIYF